MKSEWPTWIAAFRAYWDHPDAGTQREAQEALNAAEAFLRWSEAAPDQLRLDSLEVQISDLEEAVRNTLALADGEPYPLEKAGVELYEKLKLAAKEMGELSDRMDVPVELLDRIESICKTILIRIFKVEDLDIEKLRRGLWRFNAHH